MPDRGRDCSAAHAVEIVHIDIEFTGPNSSAGCALAITRLIEHVDRLDGTIRYERLSDDLAAWVEGDVELEPSYQEPINLAEWYGDDRVRDLATAWGQADRLRFGY